jgi:hypothetical protein
MGRLIRMDRTGHTTLAEWTAGDEVALARARAEFTAERERGLIASASGPDGTAEVIRDLAADAELVIMRRPIAGG